MKKWSLVGLHAQRDKATKYNIILDFYTHNKSYLERWRMLEKTEGKPERVAAAYLLVRSAVCGQK